MEEVRGFLADLNEVIAERPNLCARENLRRLARSIYRRLKGARCQAVMLLPTQTASVSSIVDFTLLVAHEGSTYVLNPNKERGERTSDTPELPVDVWERNGSRDPAGSFAGEWKRRVIAGPEPISGEVGERILNCLPQPDLKLPPAPVEMEKPAVSSNGRLSLDEIDRRFRLPRYSHEHETGPPEG